MIIRRSRSRSRSRSRRRSRSRLLLPYFHLIERELCLFSERKHFDHLGQVNGIDRSGKLAVIRVTRAVLGKLRKACRSSPVLDSAGIRDDGFLTVHVFEFSIENPGAVGSDDDVLSDEWGERRHSVLFLVGVDECSQSRFQPGFSGLVRG